ncbi:hypothetical protein [Cellulomonas sp. P5_C6]
MKFRKLAVLGVATGLLATTVALAGPASADPVSGSYVAVGSDTLQDSMNALVNGTTASGPSVRVLSAGTPLASYDAFGSANIQTKPKGPFFGRPGGSGAGVNALIASIKGTTYNNGSTTSAAPITGQVDIARSSSGPGSNANTAGLLVYVPFARDAVAYAYKAANAADAAVMNGLTTAQLTSIYTASAPTTIGSTTIRPRLPQSNSGTRKFFLGAIAVGTPGTAVPATDNTPNGPAENDATVLAVGDLMPFSVASWIAQSNGVAPSTIGSTGVEIGSPLAAAPFTGTAPSLVANSAFYTDTTWGRDTYLVVEYAKVNPSDAKYDVNLATLVDPTKGGNSLVSFGALPSSPGAVKKAYGFLAPSSATPIRAYATLP